MSEQERGAGLEVRRDLGRVDGRLGLVGEEDRDELRAPHRLGDRAHREAGRLGGLARGALGAQADLDVDAGVREVERVGVSLAAVAEDRDLAGEEIEVALAVDGCHSDAVPS